MDSKKLFMTLVPDQKMAMSRQDCTTIPRSSGCEADLAGNIRRHEEILGSDVLERSHVTRATGIGRATITNILSGRREISKGNVSKLARYFSVDPSVFLAEA